MQRPISYSSRLRQQLFYQNQPQTIQTHAAADDARAVKARPKAMMVNHLLRRACFRLRLIVEIFHSRSFLNSASYSAICLSYSQRFMVSSCPSRKSVRPHKHNIFRQVLAGFPSSTPNLRHLFLGLKVLQSRLVQRTNHEASFPPCWCPWAKIESRSQNRIPNNPSVFRLGNRDVSKQPCCESNMSDSWLVHPQLVPNLTYTLPAYPVAPGQFGVGQRPVNRVVVEAPRRPQPARRPTTAPVRIPIPGLDRPRPRRAKLLIDRNRKIAQRQPLG